MLSEVKEIKPSKKDSSTDHLTDLPILYKKPQALKKARKLSGLTCKNLKCAFHFFMLKIAIT